MDKVPGLLVGLGLGLGDVRQLVLPEHTAISISADFLTLVVSSMNHHHFLGQVFTESSPGEAPIYIVTNLTLL